MKMAYGLTPCSQSTRTTMDKRIHDGLPRVLRFSLLRGRGDGRDAASLALPYGLPDQSVENRRTDVPATSMVRYLDEP